MSTFYDVQQKATVGGVPIINQTTAGGLSAMFDRNDGVSFGKGALQAAGFTPGDGNAWNDVWQGIKYIVNPVGAITSRLINTKELGASLTQNFKNLFSGKGRSGNKGSTSEGLQGTSTMPSFNFGDLGTTNNNMYDALTGNLGSSYIQSPSGLSGYFGSSDEGSGSSGISMDFGDLGTTNSNMYNSLTGGGASGSSYIQSTPSNTGTLGGETINWDKVLNSGNTSGTSSNTAVASSPFNIQHAIKYAQSATSKVKDDASVIADKLPKRNF